jgi:GT2 family glycosyltransferase
MTLSVIIPAYNDIPGVLTGLNSLRALQSQTVAIDYHVQDDASPSALFSAVIPPEIATVQRNESNLGFGGNCNAGAAQTSGEINIILFINQDVFGVYGHSENWDIALLNAFADDSVGIVGARLLFPTGGIQSAGGLIDARGQPFHRCLGWRNIGHPDSATPRDVTWVTGAALAIRRELFERLGGFDPLYVGGYFEDVDLALRARECGFRVRYEPGCALVHRVGSTGGSPHFRQNAMRFKARWVDSGRITPDVTYTRERFW